MTGATARGARESGVGCRPGTPPQTQAGQFKAKTMPWLARLVALLFLVVTACLWRMGAADLPVAIGGFGSFAIWPRWPMSAWRTLQVTRNSRRRYAHRMRWGR